MHPTANLRHHGPSARRRFRSPLTAAAALTVILAGLAIAPGLTASAAPQPRLNSGAACNATVTAGSGTVVAQFIVGVTAGTTQIKFDCNKSSSAGIAAEASLLAGVGTTSVMLASVADTSDISTFTASSSDTGCPAGVAGSCTVASFPVPATFTAGDPKAACPPTQLQFNDGIWGCVIAVATTAQQPVAEYLVTYASQTTPPNAPTIAATVASGPPGSTITVSDAAAATGSWWANAVQQSQAYALGGTPAIPPSLCGAGGGYGNVPAPFLEVNWFAGGSATAIAGSAAGVAISDDCYDGTTLNGPALSGTIPVPSTLTVGTSYTAYLCELNITSLPSNDASATAHCGPAPAGASWIDASFAFSAAAGTAQAGLSVTSLSGTVGTPLALTTSGGSGTGAVSFVVVNGSATGCAVTNGALSATTGGTCFVTATKAADSTYLAVSSTPTTVTLAALPVVTLVTTHATLKSNAKTLAIKISCTNAPCDGTLDVSASVIVRKVHGVHRGTKETIDFGTASFHVSRQQVASVTIHLSGASQKFLEGNPDRPTIQANVYITDNLGKKHSYLGRVSLLK
ncbi:MAG: hypothetical protein ACHQFZ_05365 [Acidimicrobiales bacterium]